MKAQTAMFDADRLTMQRALDLTAESLAAYGSQYKHWAIAYSGGKDSSAVVAVVCRLLETGRIPAPESLTVLRSDTRMEITPLDIAARKMMDVLTARGYRAETVLPLLDERFFVYMFGRGVPPPKNRFRWCTSQLKIEPMEAALKSLRDTTGEKILMLTGVRLGESAARDQRIALSCSRDGSECGQGWFQQMTPESIADTLAPLLHWRVCHVWDYLMWEAPDDGFPTRQVADVYGLDEEGSQAENGTRTGCIGCNLASKDTALDNLLKRDQWAYLEPLKRLKPLYAELTKAHHRLRKDGTETKVDGTLVANPQRLGPLTMDARRFGLQSVLDIQNDVNIGAIHAEKPRISLINGEEQSRIYDLIAANTWPQRWSGEEITGDVELPIRFTRGGGQQYVIMLEALKGGQ